MSFRLSLAILCFVVNNVRPDKGIVVSGGYSTGDSNAASTNVEVYVPSNGQSCSLPPLPKSRMEHTMDNLLICGGGSGDTLKSCMDFSAGQWTESHTMVQDRRLHTSWGTDQGLVIMAGISSTDTTEIVPTTGEQGGPTFAMNYDTWSSCAIPDATTDSVVMTGGLRIEKVVSRYDLEGFVEELPELNEGRYQHGCGSYMRPDGTQVMMVAGGWRGTIQFKSSEFLISGSTAWTMAEPLPYPVYGLRGVTLGNTLYMTGGKDYFDSKDYVFEWSDEKQEWGQQGKLQTHRYFHAVSTIELEGEVMDYCT